MRRADRTIADAEATHSVVLSIRMTAVNMGTYVKRLAADGLHELGLHPLIVMASEPTGLPVHHKLRTTRAIALHKLQQAYAFDSSPFV
jgi:hypothetical protein